MSFKKCSLKDYVNQGKYFIYFQWMWVKFYAWIHQQIQRGDSPLPWQIAKYRVFLAILVQIPWKITKLPSQHSRLGHYQHASETPYKWHFAGGPMMARLKCYLDPPTPYQLKKKKKKSFLWQNFLDPRMESVNIEFVGLVIIDLHFGNWVPH